MERPNRLKHVTPFIFVYIDIPHNYPEFNGPFLVELIENIIETKTGLRVCDLPLFNMILKLSIVIKWGVIELPRWRIELGSLWYVELECGYRGLVFHKFEDTNWLRMLLIRYNKFVSKVYVRKDIPSNRICYENLLFPLKLLIFLKLSQDMKDTENKKNNF